MYKHIHIYIYIYIHICTVCYLFTACCAMLTTKKIEFAKILLNNCSICKQNPMKSPFVQLKYTIKSPFGGFLRWGVPLNHPLIEGMSIINHPAIGGVPLFVEPPHLSSVQNLYHSMKYWLVYGDSQFLDCEIIPNM